MRLITPIEWSKKYFAEGSRPSETSIRRWLNEGKLPGRKIGGSWYIDEHLWLADGDELVHRILAADTEDVLPRSRNRK